MFLIGPSGSGYLMDKYFTCLVLGGYEMS